MAYNNEGFVTLGYRIVNESVGQEWAMLEIGTTVRQGVKDYVLKRDALSIETPDGKTIPMATNEEFLNRISTRCRTGPMSCATDRLLPARHDASRAASGSSRNWARPREMGSGGAQLAPRVSGSPVFPHSGRNQVRGNTG